ncbi:MAG: cation diffusion facilitator family transporter [Enterococcus sp.]
MVQDRYNQLKQAEKGAIISICAYILISSLKLIIGNLANSAALRADGLNNFTDILASVAVLIGLRLSRKPADEEHRYGHWKAENIASLITSFIMLLVGIEVLYSTTKSLFQQTTQTPELLAAIIGIISALLMYGVYYYNKKLALKVNSSALMAAAKDNRSDAWTSIGTAVAVFAASFNLGWLDSLAAIVVALLILKTAIDIFRESVFLLSDGFDQQLLETYQLIVIEVVGVEGIKAIRGRNYGANIFLDVVILVNPELTVSESHRIADRVEEALKTQCGVFDTDVHIEPNWN